MYIPSFHLLLKIIQEFFYIQEAIFIQRCQFSTTRKKLESRFHYRLIENFVYSILTSAYYQILLQGIIKIFMFKSNNGPTQKRHCFEII